jgi:tight adherence protein B
MIWLSLVLFGIAALLLLATKTRRVEKYFPEVDLSEESTAAINVGSLVPKKGIKRAKESFRFSAQSLGPKANLLILAYMIGALALSWYLGFKVLTNHAVFVMLFSFIVLLFMGYQWMLTRRRKIFQQTFPDALNILMSAVTAGESLMQAISFVGRNLDNEIGREFKHMGDRLKLGEDPDVVFQRAVKRFAYPEFIFFTVTLRANISRGGQLKGVLARLIRVLVDSRTMETKKMAMTSEARISAKVVAAIPLIFAIILYRVNPDNINFILYDPEGIWILYYVVGSELLGLFIVWLLVKAVRL